MIKMPLNLDEALFAIAELQARAERQDAQSNLLLGFIVSEPQNLQRFADFAIAIADSNDPMQQGMRIVAQRLLEDGLAAHASSPPASSSPIDDFVPGEDSNILRFPGKS